MSKSNLAIQISTRGDVPYNHIEENILLYSAIDAIRDYKHAMKAILHATKWIKKLDEFELECTVREGGIFVNKIDLLRGNIRFKSFTILPYRKLQQVNHNKSEYILVADFIGASKKFTFEYEELSEAGDFSAAKETSPSFTKAGALEFILRVLDLKLHALGPRALNI